ncbi:hypothetical protein CG724_17695 [Streptomyces sp. CB02120-2]|nr:hypothetical protein CG724_17695 [Streptomyces sp. CB02120-2]
MDGQLLSCGEMASPSLPAAPVSVAGRYATRYSCPPLGRTFRPRRIRPRSARVFGYHVTSSTGALFLYGIAIGALALLGLALMLAGGRRAARRDNSIPSQRESAVVDREGEDLIQQRDARLRANRPGPRRRIVPPLPRSRATGAPSGSAGKTTPRQQAWAIRSFRGVGRGPSGSDHQDRQAPLGLAVRAYGIEVWQQDHQYCGQHHTQQSPSMPANASSDGSTWLAVGPAI